MSKCKHNWFEVTPTVMKREWCCVLCGKITSNEKVVFETNYFTIMFNKIKRLDFGNLIMYIICILWAIVIFIFAFIFK